MGTAFFWRFIISCICGAVAGAQIVIGANYGKQKTKNNEEEARSKAKEFVEEFKKNRKATCCKVLTAGMEFGSPERKQNCSKLVEECSEILDKMVKQRQCHPENTK